MASFKTAISFSKHSQNILTIYFITNTLKLSMVFSKKLLKKLPFLFLDLKRGGKEKKDEKIFKNLI